VQRQRAERARRLLQNLTFDDGAVDGQVRRHAPQPFDCRHRLEPDESISVLERGDEHVHGSLRGDQRQRGRDVPAHPDVFVDVAHEICERIDDVFTVVDEHLPCRALEQAVAQQRHQRWNEQEIAMLGPEPARTRDCLAGDAEVGVEHQRYQNRPEPGVVHVSERMRHLEPHRHGLLARVGGEVAKRRLGGRPVRF
jgi:hypothetical protein